MRRNPHTMRVGILWRAEWDPPNGASLHETCKLRGVFAAFAALGIQAEPVVYADDAVADVRRQLLALDGVLVWVNPLEQGLDRSRLDPLLREVAANGVFVSAHPDVILKIGTKEVLVATRSLGWGSETVLYRTIDELRDGLLARLEACAVVLKQYRGMGGIGVWKVELGGAGALVVQEAAGGAASERLQLDELLRRLEPYLAVGPLVAQPYQARIAEGMIRAYLTHDRVVGFTHQYPRGLLPPDADPGPAGKEFDPPTDLRYGTLRERLEDEWVPGMQRILDVATNDLPVIWDADFLFGDDASYVLCEINASSTFAFPELAMPGVAQATVDRIAERR